MTSLTIPLPSEEWLETQFYKLHTMQRVMLNLIADPTAGSILCPECWAVLCIGESGPSEGLGVCRCGWQSGHGDHKIASNGLILRRGTQWTGTGGIFDEKAHNLASMVMQINNDTTVPVDAFSFECSVLAQPGPAGPVAAATTDCTADDIIYWRTILVLVNPNRKLRAAQLMFTHLGLNMHSYYLYYAVRLAVQRGYWNETDGFSPRAYTLLIDSLNTLLTVGPDHVSRERGVPTCPRLGCLGWLNNLLNSDLPRRFWPMTLLFKSAQLNVDLPGSFSAVYAYFIDKSPSRNTITEFLMPRRIHTIPRRLKPTIPRNAKTLMTRWLQSLRQTDPSELATYACREGGAFGTWWARHLLTNNQRRFPILTFMCAPPPLSGSSQNLTPAVKTYAWQLCNEFATKAWTNIRPESQVPPEIIANCLTGIIPVAAAIPWVQTIRSQASESWVIPSDPAFAVTAQVIAASVPLSQVSQTNLANRRSALKDMIPAPTRLPHQGTPQARPSTGIVS